MPIAVLAMVLAYEPLVHKTPAWLPRYGVAQAMCRPGTVAPALRIGWEVDLIDQPRNVLVFIAELGTSYGDFAGGYFQHVALFGAGYRQQRQSGLYWGFGVGFGPAWYGYRNESLVDVYVEGRAHLGWRLGPVTVALAAGYAQWVAYRRFSTAQLFLGGVFGGLMLGWK
jgi:hypothetical protein